jgi:type IV pilus assembly protein PilW
VFFTSMFAVRTDVNDLGCVDNALNDTDVLQLKFLEGVQVTAAAQVNTNRYYLLSELMNVVFIRGNNVAFPLTGLSTSITNNGLLWPYSHHVYYIRNDTIRINNQDRAVPTLRRKRLNNTSMIDEVVMEGVENIRYNFGIDSNADGRVDTYLTPDLMTQANWQNDNSILTVQIFILVRSLEPDPFLNLTNRTYQLGNGANNRITFLADDNFRRTVFSTTIQLNNMGARAW